MRIAGFIRFGLVAASAVWKMTANRYFTSVAIGLMACLATFTLSAGTILLYDGAPYANKGETGGYSRSSDTVKAYDGLLNQKPSSELIVGFDSTVAWNNHGSSTLYVLPSSCNLALPELFTKYGFENQGSAAFGFLRSENNAAIYGFDRKFAASLCTTFTDAFAASGSTKYYLRVLMAYSGENSYASTSFKHGLGFVPAAFSGAGIGSMPKTGFAIGMSKASGTVEGTLWVAGTEYDLGVAIEAGTTYVGIVEVNVNGGADGAERFRAFVVKADDFPKTPTYCETLNDGAGYVDAALSAPQYMALMGSYGVQSQPVAFDEITIGTEYSDVAPYVVEGLDCRLPVVSDVTENSASVSGQFIYTSLDSAALSVIYGRSDDALTEETSIGTKTESGTYGATLTGLVPATKYFCATKGVYSATKTSETVSFTTLGSASVSAVTLTGSVEEGLTMSATVDLGYVGYVGATIELYIGTDADSLALVKSWENQTESGTFSFMKTDGIDYGATYYAQFKIVQTVAEGETREIATDVISHMTPANLVWQGADGADFADASNWTPSVAPFSNAQVIFDRAAHAVLAADAEVATLKYATAAEVTLDLGGHTLTAGALAFGDTTGGTLTVTNGTLTLPNGSFSTGRGNTLRLVKGATLIAPALVQTADAFTLFVDGGKYEASKANVNGKIVVGKDGFFRGTSSGNGEDYLGSSAAGDGAQVLVNEGGEAYFNWLNIGASGVKDTRLVVSNATASISVGPTMNAGATFVLYGDAGKTATLSNWGNLNMTAETAAIRIFGGLYTSNSKSYQNIPGELEIARTNGCFKTTNASVPLNVTGSLRFDLPKKGYKQIPLQVAGALQWGDKAKIYVDVAEFHGQQTIIRAKSVSANLTADDFEVVNGKAQNLTVTITPATEATDTTEAQPGTVAIEYVKGGLAIIFR